MVKGMKNRHQDRSKNGICMVVGAFYPELSGGALQCFNLIQVLKEEFDFYVIATYKISSKMPKARGLFSENDIDGISVFRIFARPGRMISELISLAALIAIFFRIQAKVAVFHLHGYTRKSVLIAALAKLFGKKVIIKCTSFGIDDPLSIVKRRGIAARLYAGADGYIVTSPAQAAGYRTTDLAAGKFFFIPNGVDIDRFCVPSSDHKTELRQAMSIPSDAIVLLSVGFFSKDKRMDIIVKALEQIGPEKRKDLFLIFVGSRDCGELEVDRSIVETVDAVLKKLGLMPRTLFIEATGRIEDCYKAADVFIFPSRREGLPNALLEAMACGLACIAGRLQGITDYIIANGVSGLLVDTEDPAPLAKALDRVISDIELRRTLGENARDKVTAKFDMKHIRAEYAGLYRRLMEKV